MSLTGSFDNTEVALEEIYLLYQHVIQPLYDNHESDYVRFCFSYNLVNHWLPQQYGEFYSNITGSKIVYLTGYDSIEYAKHCISESDSDIDDQYLTAEEGLQSEINSHDFHEWVKYRYFYNEQNKCVLCEQAVDVSSLEKHVVEHLTRKLELTREADQCDCGICGAWIPIELLKDHYEEHIGEELDHSRDECWICKQQYGADENREEHVYTHIGQHKKFMTKHCVYKCNVCNYEITDEKDLHHHQMLHSMDVITGPYIIRHIFSNIFTEDKYFCQKCYCLITLDKVKTHLDECQGYFHLEIAHNETYFMRELLSHWSN
jgi:hypothetical protein